ncbi:MAG: DUF6491 family protein [Pseudomonadales bacterium]
MTTSAACLHRSTTFTTYFTTLLLTSIFSTPLIAQELPSEELGIHKVGSWHAASDTTLIIEDHQHNQYLAILKSPCKGLKSAKSIAFTNHTSNTLSKSSTLILPSGKRCAFKNFTQQLTTTE